MSERNLHQDMTEAERRISNVALMGQVVALDTARARVRVQAGPITTGWLPFATVRAGLDRTWHPPEPGELFGHETLRAEANAVESTRTHRTKFGGVHRAWVGFACDLAVINWWMGLDHGIQD